jgi:DNA repair photolyase
MVGVGRLATTPAITDEYRLGYLAAVTEHALDLDAERRARAFLLALDASTRDAVLKASGDPTRFRRAAAAFVPWTAEAARGFAAGTFDAGRDRARRTLRDELRFIHVVDPASRRLRELEGRELEPADDLAIVAIEDTRVHTAMFDITTGTGDFIANGVVSHNCYARPGHEYLSFSAGTDFEKKIVVKPRAPELLREAFEKRSWKGDLIVFSGVTDCYQPLERKMAITRACLEVCAEYRNPVGIITKSPVIERDVDVLQELARVASVRVSVSVPFWDADVAKAMEPWVTTPQRRMKTVETLARAGIPVGVSVSPIVPGLNDDHLGEVLKAASEAGATHAFYVLLRLPGAVKDVFENRLRQNLPLRAEKVLRRMREAHGGKLYDASYGKRQSGAGQYADMIAALFERTAKRHGLSHDEMRRYAIASTFRRPDRSGQTSFGF